MIVVPGGLQLGVERERVQADILRQWEQTFRRLSEALLTECRANEHFTLALTAEESQFTRFNRARVRQSGLVQDGELTLTWMADQRVAYRKVSFTGDWGPDWLQVQRAVAALRQELPQLPADPFIVLPQGQATSRSVYPGVLLPEADAVPCLLQGLEGLDFSGIYAAGQMVRAQADSVGQQHWFATTSFTLDYSLFNPDGSAAKGTFAGRHWDAAAYDENIARSRHQLQQLQRPVKVLPRGQYRTYLAPAAIAELVLMMSWGCLSEAAIRQGGSPMELLRQGDKTLSPLLTVKENFGRGLVPQFNREGDLAPDSLTLIGQGQLQNTLISARTGKEYGLTSNGATESEDLRAAEVEPGSLREQDILAALGTGLYLSNLHYLNWSDRPKGRITGMTRYACFWVEDGEIVAPIENMRFDDSLFRFWGENLMALTDTVELVPTVDTYEHRALGGTWTPGMLIDDMTYTL